MLIGGILVALGLSRIPMGVHSIPGTLMPFLVAAMIAVIALVIPPEKKDAQRAS